MSLSGFYSTDDGVIKADFEENKYSSDWTLNKYVEIKNFISSFTHLHRSESQKLSFKYAHILSA